MLFIWGLVVRLGAVQSLSDLLFDDFHHLLVLAYPNGDVLAFQIQGRILLAAAVNMLVFEGFEPQFETVEARIDVEMELDWLPFFNDYLHLGLPVGENVAIPVLEGESQVVAVKDVVLGFERASAHFVRGFAFAYLNVGFAASQLVQEISIKLFFLHLFTSFGRISFLSRLKIICNLKVIFNRAKPFMIEMKAFLIDNMQVDEGKGSVIIL